MHRKHRLLVLTSLLLVLALLAGCKVVEIPEDAWFKSSSSSSYVQELASDEEATPVDTADILTYDLLDGASLFVADNPDGTQSLFYEKEGARTRLFDSGEHRRLIYPLLNDGGTTASFLYMNAGGQISPDEYVGELYTVALGGDAAEAIPHGVFVRSYADYPRGYYWYNDETVFISSGMVNIANPEDVVGFYSLPNQQMNNIVGGEHVADSARQGVIAPDGKTITYTGFFEAQGRYFLCIFDMDSGETTYWYSSSSTGSGVDPMVCFRFIDDYNVVTARTYRMKVDAEGNIIYDETPEEEQAESDIEALEEEAAETSESETSESETSESEASESEASESETSETDESVSTSEQVVNSIFTLDIRTGEQKLLIEHAYKPAVNHAGDKVYFHYTAFSDFAKTDGDNLTKRVFCYDVKTGDVTEVTEAMGITSSYQIFKLEQRINGYEG